MSAALTSALDTRGFFVAEGTLDARFLDELRAGFECRCHTSAAERDTGTRHTSELSGADPAFARVLELPLLCSAVRHVLGEAYRLQHYSGRDPLPGFGAQGLHTDAVPRGARAPYQAATVLVLLDDFTADNGATRVVPGTHLLPGAVPESYAAPGARHREELAIVAPAGSLLCLNGHLWHSGTRNRSRASRRVLQIQFVA